MNWLNQLFTRRRLYKDVSDEIQEHLEEKLRSWLRTGCREKKPRRRLAARLGM